MIRCLEPLCRKETELAERPPYHATFRNFQGKRNFKEKYNNIILYIWEWPKYCKNILSQSDVYIS